MMQSPSSSDPQMSVEGAGPEGTSLYYIWHAARCKTSDAGRLLLHVSMLDKKQQREVDLASRLDQLEPAGEQSASLHLDSADFLISATSTFGGDPNKYATSLI